MKAHEKKFLLLASKLSQQVASEITSVVEDPSREDDLDAAMCDWASELERAAKYVDRANGEGQVKTLATYELLPKPGNAPCAIVLSERRHEDGRTTKVEFVTHLLNHQTGGFSWGHYFGDVNPSSDKTAALEAEARKDFRERCERGY